jgi:hypothetical protein
MVYKFIVFDQGSDTLIINRILISWNSVYVQGLLRPSSENVLKRIAIFYMPFIQHLLYLPNRTLFRHSIAYSKIRNLQSAIQNNTHANTPAWPSRSYFGEVGYCITPVTEHLITLAHQVDSSLFP